MVENIYDVRSVTNCVAQVTVHVSFGLISEFVAPAKNCQELLFTGVSKMLNSCIKVQLELVNEGTSTALYSDLTRAIYSWIFLRYGTEKNI